MNEVLLGILIIFSLSIFILLIILWRRRSGDDLTPLQDKIIALDNKQKTIEDTIKDEIARNRQETAVNAQQAREELSNSLKNSSDSLLKMLVDMTKLHEKNFEAIRQTMESQLRTLREDNSKKLEQMRAIVDEKLQSTLEKRLGESFKQVSERLEQVYKGLGEMRSLATGVGDLKKVLTNVKTRGTWGEIQLSAILEQILTPDQYDVNVATKANSNDRVEFAIKLPGQDPDKERVVWLPIDSKFPQEDYQRLIDAQEAADKELAEKSIKNLETRIKAEARFIKEKYIDPPNTTDFGIMFLPVEGLYAEVLRRPGLCDFLQRKFRIVITGPTTLAALLNSLQMGFRTLAIEKRSSEVWELLGLVKTEFGKFGDMLAKTKKKLQEASNTIDKAEVRTRAIERKLRNVEEVPPSEALSQEEPTGSETNPQ
jgi:DNA recombination protein RmuC